MTTARPLSFLTVALALPACLFLAGCSSVGPAEPKFLGKDPSGENALMQGEVWGCYLFGSAPLVTGDPEYPGTSCLFKDSVHEEGAAEMLSANAKRFGVDEPMIIDTREESLGWPFLWLVVRKNVHATGRQSGEGAQISAKQDDSVVLKPQEDAKQDDDPVVLKPVEK